MPKKSKLYFYIGLAVVGLLLLGFYFKFNPTQHHFFPKCLFHSLTGLHCPGCGSQRALHAILNGHIIEGLKHNLLIVLAFTIIVYKGVRLLITHFKPQYLKTDLLYKTYTPLIILVFVIAFWVLRNIPVAPFSYLAP